MSLLFFVIIVDVKWTTLLAPLSPRAWMNPQTAIWRRATRKTYAPPWLLHLTVFPVVYRAYWVSQENHPNNICATVAGSPDPCSGHVPSALSLPRKPPKKHMRHYGWFTRPLSYRNPVVLYLVADLSAEFYRCVWNSEVLSIKKREPTESPKKKTRSSPPLIEFTGRIFVCLILSLYSKQWRFNTHKMLTFPQAQAKKKTAPRNVPFVSFAWKPPQLLQRTTHFLLCPLSRPTRRPRDVPAWLVPCRLGW